MRKVSSDASDAPAADVPAPAHPAPTSVPGSAPAPGQGRVPEIGGFKGPEPTRYGDWEHHGRCTDF